MPCTQYGKKKIQSKNLALVVLQFKTKLESALFIETTVMCNVHFVLDGSPGVLYISLGGEVQHGPSYPDPV